MKYNLNDLFSPKDRVILITGGAGGIGGGIAKALAELDAITVILDINKEKVECAVNEIIELGGKAYGVTPDITDEAQVEQACEEIYAKYGRIDGLINCAGTSFVESLLKMPIEKFKKVMDINLMGTVICAKVAGRYMVEQRYGRIINIASLAAFQGKPNYTAYTSSKAAVNGFTITLATEWSRKGVTVNSISPVMIVTEINRKQIEEDPEYAARVASLIPIGRISKIEDLVGMVTYLLSESASYVTGQCMSCDGGALNGSVVAIKPEE